MKAAARWGFALLTLALAASALPGQAPNEPQYLSFQVFQGGADPSIPFDGHVGFHALTNRGYGLLNPPADVGAKAPSIVAESVGLWTSRLAQAGGDPARIYMHIAFLSRATFATQPVPPGTTYEMLVNLLPSTQRPPVAFVASARPGFSTHPANVVFDQIQGERARVGNPAWVRVREPPMIPFPPQTR